MKNRCVVVALAAVAGCAAVASAQSRNSFLEVELHGVAVNPVSALEYQVTVNPGAYFHFDGTDYLVADIFGFWALADSVNVSGGVTDFGVWDGHSNNAGAGGVMGWKTNPNTGINVGESVNFTFDSLDLGTVDHWGFHVSVDGANFPNTGGVTGYVVPAPASAALLGLGGLAAGRRRR